MMCDTLSKHQSFRQTHLCNSIRLRFLRKHWAKLNQSLGSSMFRPAAAVGHGKRNPSSTMQKKTPFRFWAVQQEWSKTHTISSVSVLIYLRFCKGEDHAFWQRGVGREAASQEKVVNEGIDRYNKLDNMQSMCMRVFSGFFYYIVGNRGPHKCQKKHFWAVPNIFSMS